MATLTVAIGVFNSWVMLLMNSFLISASLFCLKRLRYNNQNETAVNATRKTENKIGIAIRLKIKVGLSLMVSRYVTGFLNPRGTSLKAGSFVPFLSHGSTLSFASIRL